MWHICEPQYIMLKATIHTQNDTQYAPNNIYVRAFLPEEVSTCFCYVNPYVKVKTLLWVTYTYIKNCIRFHNILSFFPKCACFHQWNQLPVCHITWKNVSRDMSKPTKWLCAQRRLRSAWESAQSDQSSLCAQRVVKDPSFLHTNSEDSDQIGRMPRLIWVFAGHTLILFVLSSRRSYTECLTSYLTHSLCDFDSD